MSAGFPTFLGIVAGLRHHFNVPTDDPAVDIAVGVGTFTAAQAVYFCVNQELKNLKSMKEYRKALKTEQETGDRMPREVFKGAGRPLFLSIALTFGAAAAGYFGTSKMLESHRIDQSQTIEATVDAQPE